MFSTDRFSADLKLKEYKNVAADNAKLDKKKSPKKSFASRLVSIINL